MVFVHGGGNVVVSVQYRLGPLGWLAQVERTDQVDLHPQRIAVGS
jgi:carboxylesterase type B